MTRYVSLFIVTLHAFSLFGSTQKITQTPAVTVVHGSNSLGNRLHSGLEQTSA